MAFGRSKGRAGWAVAAISVLAISASGTASAQSPSTEPAASSATESGAPASTPPLLVPTIDLSQVGGPGEGQLNIINWIGYAESGANLPEYNWVTPFTQQTGCVVNSKVDDSSDQMVQDMRQSGGTLYDGVSASGDATGRLIANGDVAPIDVTKIPGFSDVVPFLQNAPHYVVGGVHYGTPHGWGGNILMYNTEKITPAPTSWDSVFDPAKLAAMANPTGVTAYDSPIYIADAAIYLKAHQPDLGITDPYELTQPQFDAAVALLQAQHPYVGQYWSLFSTEIDNFQNDVSEIGTAWSYQLNALQGLNPPAPVAAVVPTEGMSGWADTWMMSSHAQHPNCMQKWMAWMLTPEVQTQVAEYFGEAPANPKACQYLDKGYGSYQFKDFCTKFGVNDPNFYGSIAFWKTPQADCGDARGQTCIDYSQWTQAWTTIKG
jgi:putative spermidine/putrescine transport system substrate-binding protein